MRTIDQLKRLSMGLPEHPAILQDALRDALALVEGREARPAWACELTVRDYGYYYDEVKTGCGGTIHVFSSTEDFAYCPKCGRKAVYVEEKEGT